MKREIKKKKQISLPRNQKVSQHQFNRYSLYACPKTVNKLELKRMRTIKPEPGFSGPGFKFRPERRAFGHR